MTTAVVAVNNHDQRIHVRLHLHGLRVHLLRSGRRFLRVGRRLLDDLVHLRPRPCRSGRSPAPAPKTPPRSRQRAGRSFGVFYVFLEGVLRLPGQFAAVFHGHNRVFNQIGCVFRRSGGPHRQVPDFVCHHGKTRSRFAGARRFHRRVQRQQVGLKRYLVDGLDDLARLLARPGDLRNRRDHRFIFSSTFSTIVLASAISALACAALPAFVLVMEDISSSEEDVSSSADACSEAPSARLWLACATCDEAVATCSDASSRSVAIRPTAARCPGKERHDDDCHDQKHEPQQTDQQRQVAGRRHELAVILRHAHAPARQRHRRKTGNLLHALKGVRRVPVSPAIIRAAISFIPSTCVK